MASMAVPMRVVTRSLASDLVRRVRIRQFASSAIRRKDVASQEELPNMRHAQRPRK